MKYILDRKQDARYIPRDATKRDRFAWKVILFDGTSPYFLIQLVEIAVYQIRTYIYICILEIGANGTLRFSAQYARLVRITATRTSFGKWTARFIPPYFLLSFIFVFFFFCFFRSNEYSCSPPDVYASVLVFVGSSRVTMGVPHCSDGHRFDNGSTWWERILNGWKRWRSWNAGIERNACSGINISKYCNIPVAFYTNDLYQHRHLYIRILGSAV